MLVCFSSIRDKSVFTLLASSVTPDVNVVDCIKCRDDLRMKLDSKSAIADYMGQVFDIASFTVANVGTVKAIVDNICLHQPIGSKDSADMALLLQKVAKTSPKVRLEFAKPPFKM